MIDNIDVYPLMEYLQQQLLYNCELNLPVKDDVELLYNELSTLKCFLNEWPNKLREYPEVKDLFRYIEDVAYEIEVAIDTFKILGQKERKHLYYRYEQERLHHLARQMESINVNVKKFYDNIIGKYSPSRVGVSPPIIMKSAPLVEEDNVVGFDNEIRMLVDRLTGEQEELAIVSVIGMAGLGKTTLARKVYTNPKIVHEFQYRAWIYVSQEYNPRDVFLGVLSSINTQLTDDIMLKMNDESLAKELHRLLQSRKYLIVLDDVWTKKAWDHLKIAFPDTNNRSRVMLTSRNKEVGVYANPDFVHHLRFLHDKESWELLYMKVFHKQDLRFDEVISGIRIAEQCEGLPPAIVGLHEQLREGEKPTDLRTRLERKNTNAYRQCVDVLALSYEHLPYHLKACFLYLGIFPESYEIPVWKLIRLWVAEGFIQQIGNVNFEDMAEEYLEDLVNRNLVLVKKRRSSNGRIKTCHVHSLVREMCLKHAEEEEFFNNIRGSISISSLFLEPTKKHDRRLCIHSDVKDYLNSKPLHPYAHSFLCFALEEFELPLADISFINQTFRRIKVLDIRPIIFTSFPTDITQLIHLRYIALSGDFEILPMSISNLSNVQTLIIETSSRTLEIPIDIWKMLKLRHLHTSGSSHLQGSTLKDPKLMTNIRTLSTISPESCTENVLARTPNLKKLGIRGKLLTLMEVNEGSSLFENLAKLDRVETMKLLNDTYPLLRSMTKLPRLPQSYKFPPNLKKLTLSETLLDWEHMSTLGMLPNLEVLKLKEYAFMGTRWATLEGGFRQLKMLQLGWTDLVNWDASAHHFPRLQRLVLIHCLNLEAIPSDFGNISTLDIMELHWATSSTVASAMLIQQRRQQQSSIINGFTLTVYPSDL